MMFDTTRPVRRWLRSQLPPPQPRPADPMSPMGAWLLCVAALAFFIWAVGRFMS